MIAVTHILDCLTDPAKNSVVPVCYCSQGCNRPVVQAASTFMGICGPHAWRDANNMQGSETLGLTQQWLYVHVSSTTQGVILLQDFSYL